MVILPEGKREIMRMMIERCNSDDYNGGDVEQHEQSQHTLSSKCERNAYPTFVMGNG